MNKSTKVKLKKIDDSYGNNKSSKKKGVGK
jgi:hypothetical protein